MRQHPRNCLPAVEMKTEPCEVGCVSALSIHDARLCYDILWNGLQVQHGFTQGFTHHSLEEVDVGEPNFDVRLEAVLEDLVKLRDPPRHGVVDLLLLV